MDERTDALGNPLEIGAVYGYSKRSNGHVKVVVGKLVRINKKRVTLDKLEERTALYENNTEEEENPYTDTAQVTANAIFKLDNYEQG